MTMTAALLAFAFGMADDKSTDLTPLPASWHGTYVGTFSVDSGTPAEVGSFRGELRIEPRIGSEAVSWTIIYGEGELQQVRSYELRPVPGEESRFVIDEKNGVTIEMMLIGQNLLLGQFVVGENMIVPRYERMGDDVIRCELAVFGTKPSRTMTIEGLDVSVSTSPLRSVQRAELQRVPPDQLPPE